MKKELQVGDQAPAFILYGPNGKRVSLSSLKGKWIVLYFYPKDNTSGCTKQSIAFSEKKADFEALNTVILGVSKDSVASHQKFIDKQSLTIMLLSDPDTSTHQDYGVWKEKSMYGMKYLGAERTTFVISPEGTIEKQWAKVKVAGHVDEVLAYIHETSS